MIEKCEVNIADCDACHRKTVSDQDGNFGSGYVVNVVKNDEGTEHYAYACRETHIGPAIRNVLHQWKEAVQ